MGDGAKARRVYEEAVAYLCRNTDGLRELIGPVLWEASFSAVRDGDPASDGWRAAVRALHEAAEAAGIPGGLGLSATMGVGGWPSGPTPRSVGWVCPTGRCARVDLREDLVPESVPPVPPAPPTCVLAGRPMRLVGD
ncbi:hypothetical protein ACFV6G_08315 [Streptomyces lavendulae]|uniref:hypothetical protein n=1 Tax=Streptomyces lavendulae TaxID=1914 RepID=UPI0036A56B63